MSDKDRAQDLQHKMGKAYLDLWGSAMRRMAGTRVYDDATHGRE